MSLYDPQTARRKINEVVAALAIRLLYLSVHSDRKDDESYGVTAYRCRMVAPARRLYNQSRAPSKLQRYAATEYHSRCNNA